MRAGYHVILFDMRGQGRSSLPPAGYTLNNASEDVAALIARLGVCPHVFGYSLGGAVALQLAASQPELPCSVATFGFAACYGGGQSQIYKLLSAIVASSWWVLYTTTNPLDY